MSDRPIPASGQLATSTVSRSYSVPFRVVWELVSDVVGGLTGWRLLTSDPHAGTMRLLSLSPLRHRPLEADLRLWLDELGQTRLEIRYDEPRHILLPPVGPGRGERFLRRVDRQLAKRKAE